jgi:MFS family permease
MFSVGNKGTSGVGLSMFPIAFSIVRDQFPRQKIALGQGVISSMFASGAVIGLAVGSIIVQQYGMASYILLINTYCRYVNSHNMELYSS